MSHRMWFGAGLFLFALLLGGAFWLMQGGDASLPTTEHVAGGTTQSSNTGLAGSAALGERGRIDAGGVSADRGQSQSPASLAASTNFGGSNGAVSTPSTGVGSTVAPTVMPRLPAQTMRATSCGRTSSTHRISGAGLSLRQGTAAATIPMHQTAMARAPIRFPGKCCSRTAYQLQASLLRRWRCGCSRTRKRALCRWGRARDAP